MLPTTIMNFISDSIRFFQRGFALFKHRLRTQGLHLALIWLYGHGVPSVTGIPLMKYSKITPQIYIGSQYRKVGKLRLKKWGITHSINLRVEFDDNVHGLTLSNYCYIPVINGHAPTLHQLTTGVAFMQQTLTRSEKVYVHCQGGLSRAPTMVVAYFISQGFTLKEAVRLIQDVRPFIEIKPVQMEQLKRFESIQAEKH